MEEAMSGFSLRNVAKDACDTMTKQDMQDAHYDTRDECIEGMEKIIFRAGVVIGVLILVVALVLPIHFACVLYNHWQNSEKSAEEGGV